MLWAWDRSGLGGPGQVGRSLHLRSGAQARPPGQHRLLHAHHCPLCGEGSTPRRGRKALWGRLFSDILPNDPEDSAPNVTQEGTE